MSSRNVIHSFLRAFTFKISFDLFLTLLSLVFFVFLVNHSLSFALTHSTINLNNSLKSSVLFVALNLFNSDILNQSHFFFKEFNSSRNEFTNLSEFFSVCEDAMFDLLNLFTS